MSRAACRLPRGCSATLDFWKGTRLAALGPRHLWGRLVQAASRPAVAVLGGDGTLRAAGARTPGSALILRPARPLGSPRCFRLRCPPGPCCQTHCLLSAAPFSCRLHPPPLPVSPPPFSPLTLESLFLLLCSSKTISIKVIDDEEYEKNKTFYLEIGEPRLVEMSEKKGGGRAPGLSPACMSLSGSLMPGTCNTELTSPAPMEEGRSRGDSHPPRCAQPLFAQPTGVRPRPGGGGAPALPHTPPGRGCAAASPDPTRPSPAPRHPGRT